MARSGGSYEQHHLKRIIPGDVETVGNRIFDVLEEFNYVVLGESPIPARRNRIKSIGGLLALLSVQQGARRLHRTMNLQPGREQAPDVASARAVLTPHRLALPFSRLQSRKALLSLWMTGFEQRSQPNISKTLTRSPNNPASFEELLTACYHWPVLEALWEA